MKTIVETSTGISKYLLEDTVVLNITAEDISVGQPVSFIIADLNNSNTTVYENVTAPEDWTGRKYFFDGTNWTLNPDWVDPETFIQESLNA